MQKTLGVSCAFCTNKVAASRDFYVKYLGAKVTFDCGWYVNLEFGHSAATLQFMAPQNPQHKLSKSDGLSYNFHVMDANEEYQRLTAAGLQVIIPLEDHPWGDRGFGVQDPNGITLYFYHDTEPSPEFKQFYK